MSGGAVSDYKGYYKVLGIAQDADLSTVISSYYKVWYSLSLIQAILQFPSEFATEDLSQLKENLTSVAEIEAVEIPETKFICVLIQEKLRELAVTLKEIKDIKVIKNKTKDVYNNLLGFINPQLELNEKAHAVLKDETQRKLYNRNQISFLFFKSQLSSQLASFMPSVHAELVIGYAYEDPADPTNKPDKKLTPS